MSEAEDRSVPYPDRDRHPFWRSASGKLLIQQCRACNVRFYYPRPMCPKCFTDQPDWIACSGEGRIYSYSVMRRGVAEPYAIAFVTLDEGPRMMTNIVDCDFDALKPEQRVEMVFREMDGALTPVFRPVMRPSPD